MLPLPYKPSMKIIPNDQAPLRTYNTGFAVQRIMFSQKVVLIIISRWRDYVLACQLRVLQNRLPIAYECLGQAFLKGGGNVIVIVIVSLTGSLRKGYGLTDDVASYSSNQHRRQRVAEFRDNFFFPILQTILPSLVQNRLLYGTIHSIQSFLIMIVTLPLLLSPVIS